MIPLRANDPDARIGDCHGGFILVSLGKAAVEDIFTWDLDHNIVRSPINCLDIISAYAPPIPNLLVALKCCAGKCNNNIIGTRVIFNPQKHLR